MKTKKNMMLADGTADATSTIAQPKMEEGVVHTLPEDMKAALLAHPGLLEKWNKLTPLARNEWICWTTIVKQEITRKEHIERLQEDIMGGKKRPCCWPGCPHRNTNAQKYFK